MRNDIDDILNEMFMRSAKTNKSQTAKDAEAFLNRLNQNQNNFNNSIAIQTSEIEKLNSQVKKDLENLQNNLNMDNLVVDKVNEVSIKQEPKNNEILDSFKEMFSVVSKDIIGQNKFLIKLERAFKRPFILGFEKDKPQTTIIVNGKKGTGRHSGINNCVKYLFEKNILKGISPIYIDMSLYASAESCKLFLQDFYSAMKSENTVVVFENYNKCHKSLINNLKEIFINGKIRLNSRYANNKNTLIDIGNTLVANTTSSISCAGKILVLLTHHHQTKIADNMSSSFINSISDICSTGTFKPEDLAIISDLTTKALVEKCSNKLNFSVSYKNDTTAFLANKFTMSEGINSIENFSQKCYKCLGEYKLETLIDTATFKAKIVDDNLQFHSNDKIISIENDKEDSDTVKAVKSQFDDIIGLNEVKDYIFSLEDNYRLNTIRKSMGLKAEAPSMHMIFTGNPGTGKTTIARLVSRYLKSIGVLTGGQLIEVTRADLVGRYVGHTAPLTKQVIESAVGGVLFIDEAYSLCRGKDDSFGLESIDTLVKGMEDYRDNLIVILAGYTKEMENFMHSNSGLKSRFPNIIEFNDYSKEELMSITEIIVKNKGYKLDNEVENVLIPYYETKQEEHSRTSGNARMARNMVENAILNQSKRLIKENSQNYEELIIDDFEM